MIFNYLYTIPVEHYHVHHYSSPGPPGQTGPLPLYKTLAQVIQLLEVNMCRVTRPVISAQGTPVVMSYFRDRIPQCSSFLQAMCFMTILLTSIGFGKS